MADSFFVCCQTIRLDAIGSVILCFFMVDVIEEAVLAGNSENIGPPTGLSVYQSLLLAFQSELSE
jgi:hypothetical protein